MTRCLYILDTVVLIIGLLDMTNLASVALVSRYFRELALDALFKRIDNLSPLIRYLRLESGEDPWNGFVSNLTLLLSVIDVSPLCVRHSPQFLTRPGSVSHL